MAARTRWSTTDLLDLVRDEVELHEGRMLECFDDGRRLFARSVLPRVEEVQPADGLQGGVAVRALDGDVWLHPYVFRQVCRNGAIIAHGVHSERRVTLRDHEPKIREFLVREAVAACCDPVIFRSQVANLRSALEVPADYALHLLPLLSTRFPPAAARRLFRGVAARLRQSRDRTRFGLTNAVTSLARDTADQDERWNLEELGGAILALVDPPRPARRPGAAREVPAAADA